MGNLKKTMIPIKGIKKSIYLGMTKIRLGIRKKWNIALDMLWSERWEVRVIRIFTYIAIAGVCWYAPSAESWLWYYYPIWYSSALCFTIIGLGTITRWIDETTGSSEEGDSDE